MPELNISLPTEVAAELQTVARRTGQPVEDLVLAWLRERLAGAPDEREQVRAALLAEPGVTLGVALDSRPDEFQTIPVKGGPVSETILQDREPR